MDGKTWQLQEAKNHFSEVVDLAMKGGAQTVTKHGKPAVVIVSVEEYGRTRAPRKSLFQALRECPVDLSEIIGPRSKEPARTIHFD
jgi:antitoxin Phd